MPDKNRSATPRQIAVLGLMVLFYGASAAAAELELGLWTVVIFFVVMIVGTLAAGRREEWSLNVALILAGPAALFWLSHVVIDSPWSEAVANLATLLLLVYVIKTLIGRLLFGVDTKVETLIGATTVYLLIAISWALLYSLMVSFNAASFEGIGRGPVVVWNDLLYFSVATMTTVGYGDVRPLTPIARGLSGLQAIIGVLYVATIVASLVSRSGVSDSQNGK